MKKVYYNIRVTFKSASTVITIILKEGIDRKLDKKKCWENAIDDKIKEYFGAIEWNYECVTNKKNAKKIIIDLSDEDEKFLIE